VIGPVRAERSPEGEVEAGTALLFHKSIRKTIVAFIESTKRSRTFQLLSNGLSELRCIFSA
jgi:hypothetical protein